MNSSSAQTNGKNNDSINKFDTHGLKTGKWVNHWTESGKTSAVEYYNGGKRNGLCIYYDENGDLRTESEYLNDSLHGMFKYHSPLGTTQISAYQFGKREGWTRYYNYQGKLVEDYEYHNNMRNGIHHVYSDAGRVTVEAHYVNDLENGTRRSYRDSDEKELLLEADFVNDKRLEIRYYKNGKLVKTVRDDPSRQKDIKG